MCFSSKCTSKRQADLYLSFLVCLFKIPSALSELSLIDSGGYTNSPENPTFHAPEINPLHEASVNVVSFANRFPYLTHSPSTAVGKPPAAAPVGNRATNQQEPRLRSSDRALILFLTRLLKSWKDALIIVKPGTVIKWHRQGFKLFWQWKSRPRKKGRNRINPEVRKLIRDMSRANPLWGAPRIHGELMRLGIEVSEATVSRYMVKQRKPPSQTWRIFLNNHVKDIASIDFLVVPMVNFKLLYVLVVLSHERRKIVHFNVTDSPTAVWTGQQIIEAFPYDTAPKYLIRDNDKIYGFDFKEKVRACGITPIRTAYRSPWQNAYCERVIGTLRRDCIDHIIVFSRRHLMRVLREYVDTYYNSERTHLSLDKDSPEPRPIQDSKSGSIVEMPVLGGLHHRYFRKAA